MAALSAVHLTLLSNKSALFLSDFRTTAREANGGFVAIRRLSLSIRLARPGSAD